MPAFLEILLVGTLGVVFVAAGVGSFVHGIRLIRNWRGWIRMTAGLLIVLGACGFFGAALSASGGLDWLGSFEWPIGYTSGVVRAPNGMYVVPHTPSGRVQLYDEQRRFIRGWRINASAGSFAIRALPNGNIDIHTARGDRHFIYDPNGNIVSKGTYDGRAEPWQANPPPESFSMMIPTPWILWPLTGPSYGWLCVVAGFGSIWLLERKKKRLSPHEPAHPQLPVDV